MMDRFLHNMDWVPPLRTDALTSIFGFFTWFGYMPFFVIALPVLFWAWNKAAANRLAVLLLASALLNFFLKDLFQDPRPDPSFHLEGHSLDSFGLPSGHTQMGIVFWLWLAIEVRKPWFWVASSIFAAGIALSRPYLGVHDIEDVLGGAILGIAALLLFMKVQSSPLAFWRSLPSVARIGLLAALLAAAIFLWPVDEVPRKAHLLSGFFVGWSCGVPLEKRKVDFERPVAWKSIVAALLGLAVVAGLMKGLAPVFDLLKFPDPLARILGGFIGGFFVTFAAPLLFARLRLVNRSKTAPPRN